MMEKLKKPLFQKKEKSEKEIKEELLEKLTWEEIPLNVKEEGKKHFYQSFDFMELYMPSEAPGLERYLPHLSAGLVLVNIILTLKK